MPEIEEVVETTEEKEVEHPGLSHLSEEDKSAIIALRKENADKRVKAKAAIEELEQLKEEKRLNDEAKMLEDGKLKELLESKDKELKSLKPLEDKVTSYEGYFIAQLEEVMKELPETQRELISSTDMDVAKKLEWSQKLIKEVNGLKPIPDSVRPGGKAPEDKIDMSEYIGLDGQRKLVNLSKTNRPLYDAIIKQKNIM